MKLVNRATLLMLAAAATMATVACTPTPGEPPEHSDDLTDPLPTRMSVNVPPAATKLTPIVVDPPPSATATPAPVQATAPVADLLQQYLADASGDPGLNTAWHDHVRQITVQFNTAIIRTDLAATPLDRQQAETICRLVAAFPKSRHGQQRRSIDVQVYGRGDRLLADSHDAASRPMTTDGFVATTHDP